ncbi:MAG: quinoprotein relay system zinc metallohydrolase 2 [Pseudomonadota bacterium]
MFEAVISICLSLEAGLCRDQLLPGFEAATVTGCEAALAARPPDLDGLVTSDQPRCAPVGEVLSMQEVAPGVFAHRGEVAVPNPRNRGDVSNLGFVIGSKSVAVIDTGSARWVGEALWRAIRERTDLPVSHVVLTHMHPDHVMGVSALHDAGAEIVGHAGLPRALSDRQMNYLESFERLLGAEVFLGTVLTPIDTLVTDTLALDLGDRVLDLQTWQSSHTDADLTVFDRETGTMFTGDLIFHQHTPALDGRLRGWQTVLHDMSTIEIAQVVPGHGDVSLDWPTAASPMLRYLDVLAADTRQALDAGQRLGQAIDVIAESEAENWQLFDEFNPRNATVAYTELEWE